MIKAANLNSWYPCKHVHFSDISDNLMFFIIWAIVQFAPFSKLFTNPRDDMAFCECLIH